MKNTVYFIPWLVGAISIYHPTDIIARNMRKSFLSSLSFCLLFFVVACGNQPLPAQTEPPEISTATMAADPCSPQSLPVTVQDINDLMRKFDTASELPADLMAQQLPDIISNLQRIRRAAEDLQIPACLTTLKTHQLNHMNLMIQTLLAFMGGTDQQALNDGLERARQEHDLYSLEIVRLLGITFAPMTVTPDSPEETSAP